MSENNTFKRKCIITNCIVDANKLVRFDFDKKNNIITLDIKRQKKGRGAYFLPTIANWEALKKSKGLNRAFRTNVSKNTYDAIEQELKEAKCLIEKIE